MILKMRKWEEVNESSEMKYDTAKLKLLVANHESLTSIMSIGCLWMKFLSIKYNYLTF